ncbi:MAG: hypothetical protein J7K95_06295 [Thermoplasmata archaeon]|nr:hypothetical protein [Thermoplasmata archaeon]
MERIKNARIMNAVASRIIHALLTTTVAAGMSVIARVEHVSQNNHPAPMNVTIQVKKITNVQIISDIKEHAEITMMILV